MKEKFYSSKTISLIAVWVASLLIPAIGQSQIANSNEPVPKESVGIGLGSLAEKLWQTSEERWKGAMVNTLSTDEAMLEQFLAFNQSAYFKDRGDFFRGVRQGLISELNAGEFFNNLKEKYSALWQTEGNQYAAANRRTNPNPSPQNTCNPSCFNINFQAQTLTGWYAYYAVDNSTAGAIVLGGQTGGACGSVTQSALDPNTGNDYQVTLMTTPGNDPIAGPLIPYTPPLGGLAVMVGDADNNGQGVGIIEQTYLVDVSAPILNVQYAVLLENPGHNGLQQPWFKMEVLDQNNNPISGCGQYFVVAGTNLPGFHSFYYPANADTVYALPWSTAFVPLYNYIGQCVTVRWTASDCALGAHFGYAYVSATCTNLNLVSSTHVFCLNQHSATITGPVGASKYQWTTSGGCISGSDTSQVLTVTCGGTYTLITQSSAGAQCLDTFSINIPNVTSGPPPVPCFTATHVCAGTPTQFDASCTVPTTGTTFYWDFYNTGIYNDSSGATPSWTFNVGGTYSVRLHILTTNGCEADTTINVIVDATNVNTLPTFSTTIVNATACGQCNGTITFVIHAGNIPDTVRNSFDSTWAVIGGGVSPASVGGQKNCGALVGAGNLTYTLKFCNMCAGNYYFYIIPAAPTLPSNCTPGGFYGDTIAVTVTAGGLNITANVASTNASCGNNNGTATLTGLGGTGPYTFTWTTPNLGTGATQTGLSAGTYAVVIADANGCAGNVNVVIQSFTQLSAQLTPFNVSCFGANDGSINITPTAGTAPFTYLWSPNVSTTSSAAGLSAGSYTITITDAGGCTGILTTTIHQPTQVNASILSSVTSVNCGQTGSAIAGATGGYPPYTYKWTNGTHTASDTGLVAGTYTVTVTDGLACTGTTQVTVSTANGPNVTASPNVGICAGGNTTLTSGSTTVGVTYTWSPSAGLSCTACQNPTATPGTTTNYIVTVRDSSGCSATATVNVTVNQLPTIGVTPPFAVCTGNNATLTATGGLTYSWSNGQTATSSITVTPPIGTTNYTVTGIDVHGCINSANTSITVNPLPTVTASPDTAICLGASTVITAGGGVTYSWIPALGLNLTNISNPTATPATTTTYTVIVADANGCVNGDTTTVAVNPVANVSVSPGVTICPSSTTQLTSSGGTTYSWTPPTGLTNANISNPVASPAVTTTYTVFATNANGCQGSDTVTVTINPQLTVNMSAPAAICIGSTTLISASPSGGTSYTYTWSPSAGLSSTTVANPSANPIATTTYSVDVNDINGCHGSDTVTVTVNPLPIAGVSAPAAICAGSNTQLTAGGGTTYAWTPATGLSNASVFNPTANPTATTTYSVIVTDINGCTADTFTTVTVNPLPVVTVSPTDTICSGTGAQLTSSATGALTYLWTPPAGLSNPSISNPVASPAATTTYTVEATDANGCTNTNSVLVNVLPAPHAAANDTDICTGHSAQLNASGGTTYLWVPPTDLSNANIPNPMCNSNATITYMVYVSTGSTCPPDSQAVTVTVHPTPTVFAGDDTTVIAGSPVTLSATGTGTVYTWNPPTALSCSDCANPVAIPIITTTYIVSTTDSFGCRASDTLVVTVDDVITLYVPSGFTPDNYSSGFFYAYGIGIKDFEFYIFNRWGQVVFQSTDVHTGWDGTYKGQKVSQDVYVYLARASSYTGKSITKTGSVTVVY